MIIKVWSRDFQLYVSGSSRPDAIDPSRADLSRDPEDEPRARDAREEAFFDRPTTQPYIRHRYHQDLRVADRLPSRRAVWTQLRGQVNPEPCGGCARKNGPFAECISVPGEMGGACGNCDWSAHSRDCTLSEQPRSTSKSILTAS